MTLTEAQAALQAAQQEYNVAKAAKVSAMETGNRRAIADADARLTTTSQTSPTVSIKSLIAWERLSGTV